MLTSTHPAASRSCCFFFVFINEHSHTRLWVEVAMDRRRSEEPLYCDEASVSHMRYWNNPNFMDVFFPSTSHDGRYYLTELLLLLL